MRCGSCRVVDVDETMFEAEAARQMLAQGLDTVTLRGMVAAGQIGHAHFARIVGRGLGYFSADIGIGARRVRLLDPTLRRPCAPGQPANRRRRIPHQHGLAPQPHTERGGQVGKRGLGRRSESPKSLLAECVLDTPPHMRRELDVVAHQRMRIQRKVIGEQVDVCAEQCLQAKPLLANDARVLAAPEPAVVHEDRVGPGIDGTLDQCQAGSDAADHPGDPLLARDLHAVWAIIFKGIRLQEIVQIRGQLFAVDHVPERCICAGCG
ncbi:hypothetical protein THIARS_40017 [Thiomonas delicata]|uniref:Uncharacterized protein n=1 Tax=Thiomonas delicata TaxID=364030 RepID=A0A238CZG9_THIDL|nr:hypothetical protein THIARS_40017 [Thiomonas delicata]